MKAEQATGTDGIAIDTQVRRHYTKKQMEEFNYAQSMYAKLADKSVVRKALAIREQIWI